MDVTTLKRFIDKVQFTDSCWNWTASTTVRGYPKFKLSSYNLQLAHRVAYEWWVAPIPKGLTVDHSCNNIKCVNPDHLSVMTRQENTFKQHGSSTSHCPNGHLKSIYQVARPSGRAGTYCIACNRIKGRLNYWGEEAVKEDYNPNSRMG